jgi:hypothetical protein
MKRLGKIFKAWALKDKKGKLRYVRFNKHDIDIFCFLKTDKTVRVEIKEVKKL